MPHFSGENKWLLVVRGPYKPSKKDGGKKNMQAVTLTSAENALKSFYLDVVAHQLNTETNPLYNKIK